MDDRFPKTTPTGEPVEGISVPASGVGTSTPLEPPDHRPLAPDPRAAPEADLWFGRTHWHSFAGRIGLWFGVNLIVGFLVGLLAQRLDNLTWVGAVWIVLGVVLVSGFVVLGGIAIRVLGTRFRLTTQRMFIERGLLSRTTDQTELIRVDDVRVFQTFLNRILNIGTITLLTTDASDRSVTMEGIKDPRSVSESVRRQMQALRGKSLYMETL